MLCYNTIEVIWNKLQEWIISYWTATWLWVGIDSKTLESESNTFATTGADPERVV